MSKVDVWMPLHIADYLADTMHLNAQQHGAYMLLLMHHWRAGCIPSCEEQLSAISRCELGAWKRSVWPVLKSFFTEVDGVLIQKRAVSEREYAEGLTDKRSKAGRNGAEKRWGKNDKKTPKTVNDDGNGGSNSHDKDHGKSIAKPSQNDGPSPSHLHLPPSSLRSDTPPSSDDAVRRPDRRGSRLPADWQPGETGMSYALCHLRPDKISDEIEKFRNYWHAKAGRDATKLDWNATWRNWVLTAKQHTPTPRETAKKPSPMAWMFEEAERRKRGESIPTIDTTGRTLQ